MRTIEEPVFVDGTFHSQNIVFGRDVTGSTFNWSPSGASDSNNIRYEVTFPDGPLAGTGPVVVVVTGYGSTVSNRLVSSAIRNVTVSEVTESGFTIFVNRHTALATQFTYMAFRS